MEEMRVLGKGASSIVYGFKSMAFKVSSNRGKLEREAALQERVREAWSSRGGAAKLLNVCKVLGCFPALREAAERYGFPEEFPGKEEFIDYPVLVMEEVPRMSPQMWHRVMPRGFSPGTLRLHLAHEVSSIGAVGRRDAVEKLGIEVDAICFQLGAFLGLLLFTMGVDASGIEVLLGDGGRCFVTHFSECKAFESVEEAAEAILNNECLPKPPPGTPT